MIHPLSPNHPPPIPNSCPLTTCKRNHVNYTCKAMVCRLKMVQPVLIPIHPCVSSTLRGPKGCAKGTSCKFVHPKLCHASLVSGKCNRCYFYNVTIPKITENSRPSHEWASHSNRATPLMNLNRPPYNPPQANTAYINPTHIQHLTQSQYMPS